jgi:DNA-binding MarR family transcriptional regulator
VTKKAREQLAAEIHGGFQRNSALSVLLSQTIADKVDLAATDLECMSFLQQDGPMTAGRLAELTGLTSGAVTRLIDRLESRKYVRRRSDPNDRRRVVVELNPAYIKDFERFYGPMAGESVALLDKYSDAQLELIAGLLAQMTDFARRHAERIKALPDAPKRRRLKVERKILGQNVRVEL